MLTKIAVLAAVGLISYGAFGIDDAEARRGGGWGGGGRMGGG